MRHLLWRPHRARLRLLRSSLHALSRVASCMLHRKAHGLRASLIPLLRRRLGLLHLSHLLHWGLL